MIALQVSTPAGFGGKIICKDIYKYTRVCIAYNIHRINTPAVCIIWLGPDRFSQSRAPPPEVMWTGNRRLAEITEENSGPLGPLSTC